MEIRIKDLNKNFNENNVLNKLNLNIKNIRCLGIIGPSGGGKTTLLRILSGLENMYLGEITINGKVIPKINNELLNYRKSIGVVFQGFNLFPHLNAMENVMLPLKIVHKIPEDQSFEIGKEMLTKFSLEEHQFKKPHELSGGQQQRVAIARAMGINPNFFIFDEPTSALDPNLTKEVQESIEKLKKEKKDMILVTHDLDFVKGVADYIIYLYEGKVLEEGYVEEFFSRPKTNELKKFLEK